MSEIDYLEIEQFNESVREEQKVSEDENHNREIDRIVGVGEKLLTHCLNKVSASPEVTELEGGLNILVRTFILSEQGWSYFTRKSSGSWFEHTADAEPSKISYDPISQGSIPDLVMNAEALRLELKTVSLFTSKDRIPPDFFSKDLGHLQGDSDLEKFDYEGASRQNRRAEMCLILGDLDVIQKSKELKALIGEDFAVDSSRRHLREVGTRGIRFEIRDCGYSSKTRSKDRRLCAILAFPAKRGGEIT